VSVVAPKVPGYLSIIKLMQELATISITEFDAEARCRILAANL